MSGARRIGLVGVVALVAAGLALACAGAVAATTGAELPKGVGDALAFAGDFLSWTRLVVAVAMVWGIARVRED